MPEYQFNTNLGPAPQQGTSLGDLINTARGVQAYQQSQQLNPLEVQAKQMAIKQAEQINPLEVQAKQTELAKNQQLLTEKQAIRSAQLFGIFSDHKSIKEAEQDPTNTAKRAAAIEDIKKSIPLLESQGATPDKTEALIKHLETVDPTQYSKTFAALAKTGMDMAKQYEVQTPQLVRNAAGQDALFTQSSGQLSNPTYPPQAVTSAGVVTSGMQQPNAALQVKPSPDFVKDMYPVRKAGSLEPYGPTEKGDEAKGLAFRTRLLEDQDKLVTRRNDVDNVIADIEKIAAEAKIPETGVAGQFKRKFAELTGDPKYQELEKNLANLIAANEAALGGSTDAGRALQTARTGKLGLAPEVLLDISRRAKADMINLDMKTNGANKFAKQFGDNNYANFSTNWAKNADTNIFRIMEIHDRLGKSEEAQKEVNELLQKSKVDTAEKKAKFAEKYRNVKSMTEYGYIPEVK